MSFFKQLFASVKQATLQVLSANDAKAAAGAMLYVAKSGGISDDEFDTLLDGMKQSESFANADVDAILAEWEKIKSERMFKRDVMTMLNDIEDQKVRQDIMILCLDVAEAEDENGETKIDPDEEVRLAEIEKAVRISMRDLM